MLIGAIGEYELHVPTSGGKAGKGQNLASTIQVRFAGSIKKQIRFILTDSESRKQAIAKARQFVAQQTT